MPLTSDLPQVGDEIRVLLIDDDAADAQIVQAAFRQMSNWSIDWRSNLTSGHEALQSGRYHACLVDYSLGRDCGLDVLKLIDPVERALPVIVLTRATHRDIDIAAMKAGATDFLEKSHLSPTNLERRLRYAIGQAHTRRQLTRLARRDCLTGLHNRASVEERIEAAHQRCVQSGGYIGVCWIDVDGFKAVNDEYGHSVGDAVLRTVASRIKAAIRPYDSVGRIGGDEFVVVLEQIESPMQARQVAERLLEVISAPLDIGAPVSSVTASIGFALSHGSPTTALELLRSADTAMYAAKRGGRARVAEYRRSIEALPALPKTTDEFSRAVDDGQLDVYFQPQVSLRRGAVCGAEALARWKANRAERPIDTAYFITQLERYRAIADFDLWMLGQAQRRFGAAVPGRLSINVSPVSLSDPTFAVRALAALSQPTSVAIEITERDQISDVESAIRNCSIMREAGVKIFIDDFGMGTSSLLRLRELAIDGIKVDRTFISALPDDDGDAAILEALNVLCRRRRSDIIVEGVEVREQAQVLAQLGIEHAQGFLFARPVPSADVQSLASLEYPRFEGFKATSETSQ